MLQQVHAMVGPPRGFCTSENLMPNISIEPIAAALFAVAIVHTFSAKLFERLSHRHPPHAGLFHLLGEVEVVFGFWAIVLIFAMAAVSGGNEALAYAESRQYTEPLFVFVVVAAHRFRLLLELVQCKKQRVRQAISHRSGQ
jgi:hypothetical protein